MVVGLIAVVLIIAFFVFASKRRNRNKLGEHGSIE